LNPIFLWFITNPGLEQTVISELKKKPFVKEAHEIFGVPYSVIAKIEVNSMDEFARTIRPDMHKISGLEAIAPAFVLDDSVQAKEPHRREDVARTTFLVTYHDGLFGVGKREKMSKTLLEVNGVTKAYDLFTPDMSIHLGWTAISVVEAQNQRELDDIVRRIHDKLRRKYVGAPHVTRLH